MDKKSRLDHDSLPAILGHCSSEPRHDRLIIYHRRQDDDGLSRLVPLSHRHCHHRRSKVVLKPMAMIALILVTYFQLTTSAYTSQPVGTNVTFSVRPQLAPSPSNSELPPPPDLPPAILAQLTGSNVTNVGIKFNLPELDTSNCHLTFELISGHFLADQPYKVIGDVPPGDCLLKCKSDPKCRSVNIDYRRGTCEYMSTTLIVSNEHDKSSLKTSNAQNYFEKVCLKNVNNTLCPDERYWSFERVRGHTLSGIPFKKVIFKQVTNKDACMSKCVNFEDFVCRAVEYNYDTKECGISRFNRFSIDNDLNVRLEEVAENVDYMENNCAREAKGFCNTKGIKDQRQLLSEKILIASTLVGCQNECLSSESFTCRSFTYESMSKTCSLSHHTTKSQAIARSVNHVYYEISACFEVTVDCEPDFMKINVRSNVVFHGKIYTRDRPSSCIVDVANSMDFTLPVQLLGDTCGTQREKEGIFSNVLVIQANDQVVTSQDKAVGVKCTYDVGNKTTYGQTILTVNDVGLFVEERKLTAPLPDLSLHIVDSVGSEKDVFSLGEMLRVQVRMSDEKTYGIFVRNLVAKDGTGYNNLTLIDHSGCPSEGKMMREVRTIDAQSKSLESHFEAFSFTGSSTLNLEAEVETCLDRCRPVRCHMAAGRAEDDNSLDAVYSLGRKRRSVDDVTHGDIVEATTLVKKIRILPPNTGSLAPVVDYEDVESSNSLAPTVPSVALTKKTSRKIGENQTSLKAGKMPIKEFQDEGHNLMYKVDGDGYYCFGPNSLTIITSLIIFIQSLLFTLALLITSTRRRKMTTDEHRVDRSSLVHGPVTHGPNSVRVQYHRQQHQFKFEQQTPSCGSVSSESTESGSRRNFIF